MTGRKVDIETPAESRTSMQNSLAVLQSPPHSMFLFQDNDSSRGSILSDRYPYYESTQIMENSQAIYPVTTASKLVAQEPCTLTKSNTTKTVRKADRKSATSPPQNNPAAEPSRTSLGVNVADPESGPAFLSIPEPLLKRAKSANYQPTKLKDDPESQISTSVKDGSSERIANFKLTQASSIGQWVSKIVLGNQFESGKDSMIDKLDKAERPEKMDKVEKQEKQERTETSLHRMQQSKPQSMHSLKLGNVSKYGSHSRRSSLMVDAKHVLLQDDDFKVSRSPLVYVSNNDGSAAELSGLSEVHKSQSSSADDDRQSEKRLSVASRERDNRLDDYLSVAHSSNFSYSAPSTHARSIRSIQLQILEDPEENASSHKFPTPRATEVKKLEPTIHQQPTTSDKSHKRVQKPVHKRFAARLFHVPMVQEGQFYESEPSPGHGKSIFKSGIHAFSPVASTLNLITALAILFAIFFTPYRGAFIDASDTSYATISWSISILLLFDAAFNLWVTPVLKPTADCRECTTESLKQWQIRYLSRYFMIEIIAAIPWIEIIPTRDASFPLSMLLFGKFILLPSKLRNNQILKLAHSKLRHVLILTGDPFVGLLKLCFGIVFFIHLQACVLYHIGSMNGFATWTEQFNRWKLYPGEFDLASAQDRYSVENVMPLHFIPETTVEQIFTLCFSVIGALLYASLIALLASTAMCYNVPAKVFQQKLAALQEYTAWRNLDRVTSKKLVDYFHFKYQGRYFDEQSVLGEMNESLQMELSIMHCKQHLEKVPFMNRSCADGRDDLFMGKVANALVPAFYFPGDVIVHQGERCTEMFFIQSGRVNLTQDGILEASLSDGNYFGDVALIVNAPSTFTARACAATSIYRLSAADFNSILLEFEDVKKQVDRMYEERSA
ncbi:hypothetical protein HDU81_000030 [Chytriomyces hyalinus]|nr:hypothetical protein HDU81_000030 [Chytriomyces hyalinus]